MIVPGEAPCAPSRRRTRRALWRRCSALLAVIVVAGCGGEDLRIRGAQREPIPDVSQVRLPEPGRDTFAFTADDGEILLVYFGYTACPDVCPTTLADLRSTLDELGDRAEQVELAMVTIDPARDTPELLEAYVGSFVEGAHALVSTDDTELRAAADAFGADYGVTTAPGGEPEVFHTASVYAVDDTGLLRVSWSYGTPIDDIVHDLRVLLPDG